MAGGGPQRSGELDELRHDGFPTGLRLSTRESRETHVGSASKRPIDFVERHAGTSRVICATTARLSPARNAGEGVLIWKFAGVTTRSNSLSWTHSLPNFFGRFRQPPTPALYRLPNSASSV